MVIVLTTKRFSYFIISSRETYDEVGFAKYHHAQLRTKLREAHEACCLTDIVNIYFDATMSIPFLQINIQKIIINYYKLVTILPRRKCYEVDI